MQLTKHTDYAYRVLIYLAGMEEKRTTIQTISDTYDLSKTHLMKVVNQLANEGWIDSLRGKNGGICLGTSAENINLRAVVELMENNLDPINCDAPLCHIKGVCLLKPIFLQAQSEYLNYLGRYSLADIVNEGTIARMKYVKMKKNASDRI
ncbi:MAG: Rrf2 family transcriptional regulator [Granulosicoccus sp.]